MQSLSLDHKLTPRVTFTRIQTMRDFCMVNVLTWPR